jgi:putative membrane protein
MQDFLSAFALFSGYFLGAIAFCGLFGLLYLRLTPHLEFELMRREHNASAALALGGSILGFAIGLSGAIRETHNVLEFVVWALIAVLAQLIAHALARLAYPGLPRAVESNAISAAIFLAAISIASGLISAACMTP